MLRSCVDIPAISKLCYSAVLHRRRYWAGLFLPAPHPLPNIARPSYPHPGPSSRTPGTPVCRVRGGPLAWRADRSTFVREMRLDSQGCTNGVAATPTHLAERQRDPGPIAVLGVIRRCKQGRDWGDRRTRLLSATYK